MNFKQLSTPLKILVTLLILGIAWIIYMVGFLSLPLSLSPQQLEHVNATKTAIAERWYMLLRPGFTGTPTITRTPSITPTPTPTLTLTLAPTNSPTASITPYYFLPTRTPATHTTNTPVSGPALSGPSATSAPSTATVPPATDTSLPATPMPTLPPPTLPPPTLPPPTAQPTDPPPATEAPTEDPSNNDRPIHGPHPRLAFVFTDSALEINNNILVINWITRFPRHFR